MEVEKPKMGFEETELRLGLGLPGNANNNNISNGSERKRGFSETVDWKLNILISSKEHSPGIDPNNINSDHKKNKLLQRENNLLAADPAKPPAKAQVVGWPPVRSFRKNILAVQKSSNNSEEIENSKLSGNGSFVKVSMDGAPYLRKVDLKMYKSYQDLSDTLASMFSSFTVGNCESQGMKDFMKESKLIDLLNGTDYVQTYEDKDGDWMLLGDVPWELFVESCKRLRIMKGTEATGLAPRAMEKRKNRS